MKINIKSLIKYRKWKNEKMNNINIKMNNINIKMNNINLKDKL